MGRKGREQSERWQKYLAQWTEKKEVEGQVLHSYIPYLCLFIEEGNALVWAHHAALIVWVDEQIRLFWVRTVLEGVILAMVVGNGNVYLVDKARSGLER